MKSLLLALCSILTILSCQNNADVYSAVSQMHNPSFSPVPFGVMGNPKPEGFDAELSQIIKMPLEAVIRGADSNTVEVRHAISDETVFEVQFAKNGRIENYKIDDSLFPNLATEFGDKKAAHRIQLKKSSGMKFQTLDLNAENPKLEDSNMGETADLYFEVTFATGSTFTLLLKKGEKSKDEIFAEKVMTLHRQGLGTFDIYKMTGISERDVKKIIDSQLKK